MPELDHLQRQARKCRMLAGGLSNRDDIRALEDLAQEFEDRARMLRLGMRPAPSRALDLTIG